MKSKEEYWVRIFKGYEGSGLSQEEFCRAQGLPLSKFKYQWRKKFGARNNRATEQNSSEKPGYFEPIMLSKNDSVHPEPVTSQSVIIQFPNQISCEVKIDIKSKDFSSLLNQLRLLC
jgi:hypothetical protein